MLVVEGNEAFVNTEEAEQKVISLLFVLNVVFFTLFKQVT